MKKIILFSNIICLVLLSTLLFACGGSTSDFSISLVQGEISLAVGESMSLDVKIDNYFDIDAKFDFYQTSVILTIDEDYTYKGDGVYTFNATAVAMGTATLTITLLQGNHSCDVYVNVSEPITNFYITNANSSYVIKGGDGLNLSNNLFTFVPSTSQSTGVVFTLEDDYVNDVNIIFENNVLSFKFL